MSALRRHALLASAAALVGLVPSPAAAEVYRVDVVWTLSTGP